MPIKKRPFEEAPRHLSDDLITKLSEELKTNRDYGQPTIYEDKFPNETIRVVVTWDDWDRVPMEERTAVILRAYRNVFGSEVRNRMALASGLTIPEACSAGMLPFQMLAAVRKGDPVTAEQCRQAMLEEGASVLLGDERPLLRFQTAEDAEAAKARLVRRLPSSEPVWVITQDVGGLEQWADAEIA